MENLKFVIISIIILAILVVLGLWAFGTLDSGENHVSREKLQELEDRNQELLEEIDRLEDELALLRPDEEEEIVEEQPIEEQPIQEPTTYQHQDLLDRLQDLINDNIYMSTGSKGTRVGTVQEFLNLYHNTSKRVDNDYGNTTKTDVTAFQRAEGLSADGETGPNTYRKMVEWLQAQG